MTLLHAHFALRNQQAFQRLLESSSDRGQSSSAVSAGLSTSGGKSWNRPSTLALAMSSDVNARDWLGRTVLHLACASPEPSSLAYVRLLLAHPAINVNLYDIESHWTALHRALYNGNLPAALLLLQRSDTDTSLKDLEGYTPFDLYNSTLEGTKPSLAESQAELFTWGTNRNAALGLGDSDDRTYPDQVTIHPKDDAIEQEKMSLEARFSPIHVLQVQMSRLHTTVVTAESRGNLRVCGFGSGGRLGPGQHTQYSLKPLNQFTHTIVSVALGQDHTLALTKTGEVLSWGLNRFSQLGYVVESPTAALGIGRLEEAIQATPRKVHGPLKKETVMGVAASKGASACWTSTEVFTWGTNNGQLGYDKAAQPVQVIPRRVTKVTQPVIAISITDSAMACLLNTQDVVCIWNDRHFKINFPTHAFPSEIQPYRPPQAVKDAHIAKITSCDDTFAALSSNGELFTFSVSNPSEADGASSKEKAGIKPQRVWALRKQFSAVRDVALGSDGSIVVCTESGHVFVRSRAAKGGQSVAGKTFKFQRMPYIQRVSKVCANNTGAYGALRVDFKPKAIEIHGNTLAQDVAGVQPYLRYLPKSADGRFEPKVPYVMGSSAEHSISPSFELDDDSDDLAIQNDVKGLLKLCDLLHHDRESRKGTNSRGLFEDMSLAHGADTMIHITHSGVSFPAHRLILAARCPILCDMLTSSKVIQDPESNISMRLQQAKGSLATTRLTRLSFSGCQAMSVLILLVYLYSDELLALWDRRLATIFEQRLKDLKVKPAQVKLDLQAFAHILDLPLLAQALESPAKRTTIPSMANDMDRLFYRAQPLTASPLGKCPLAPDVILLLADKEVYCHSTLLRARSLFFASFFDEEDWTIKRRDPNGIITVNLRHLKWRPMQFVLRFLCCGGDEEMFSTLDFVHSVDAILEFMFEVMSAANELLLDRLILLCAAVILRYTNINNACYTLTDATHFHAQSLIESLQGYMTVNMEILLESRMLDDLTPSLIKQLSAFVRQKQAEKSPVSRSNLLVDKALQNQGDWLALQDIPQPIVRSNRSGLRKDSPKLSPSSLAKAPQRSYVSSSPTNPTSIPQSLHQRASLGDDIFIMDPDTPSVNIDNPDRSIVQDAEVMPISIPVWKAPSAPRVDMKAVMAEAASITSSRISPPFFYRDSTLQTGQMSSTSRGTPQSKRQWPPDATEGPGSSLAGSSRLASSPWKSPGGQPPATPNVIGFPSPVPPPPNGASSISTYSEGPATPGKISRTNTAPSTPPQAQGKKPGLGPVFSPSRQTLKSEPSAPRRVSNGQAWTLPPVQPVVLPSPPTSGMSFVAIQQLQLEQGVVPGKAKRSLREIQEEEQARQAEEDFLKWWSAEEERVRLEAEAVSPPRSGQTKGPRKPTRPKVKADAKVRDPNGPSTSAAPKGHRRKSEGKRDLMI